MKTEEQKRCAVFGLGKLGLPLMVVLASKGYDVVGVDISKRVVDSLNDGSIHTPEPKVKSLLLQYAQRITATVDANKAVDNTDVAFIVVPTPSEPDGGFSTVYILQVAELIGSALRNQDRYYLVVLVSTVMPETMDKVFVPTLEKASGKKCGADLGVCYNPEFIALGSVVDDILDPDFVLIGESSERAGQALTRIYQGIVRLRMPIERMNFVSAEIAKLSLNCYVTMKISYANMLGQLCDTIPGANASRICKAIGNDSRIGHRYLVPATAYGGPCFPRDNRALLKVAGPMELLPQVVDIINQRQTARLARIVLKELPGRVAVLGLSYKPGTPIVEESAGIALAEFLCDVLTERPIVWDCDAMQEARKVLGDKVEYGESLATTLRQTDVVIIMIPSLEFVEMPPPELAGVTVIDPWGIIDPRKLPQDARYVRPGIGA